MYNENFENEYKSLGSEFHPAHNKALSHSSYANASNETQRLGLVRTVDDGTDAEFD